MTLDAEWELDRRRSWYALFDEIEQERTTHPEWDEDTALEAICFRGDHKEMTHENV